MAHAKLTELQRAELKALADKVEAALAELQKALTAVGQGDDVDGSCLACPGPGGEICSSFVGSSHSPHARCERDFCGHTRLSHVGMG